MKNYLINNNNYEIIKNYKDGFAYEEVKNKCLETDYFDNYDYIVGDWSYGKLRLKGFCDKVNLYCNRINDIKFKDKYLKELCSYDCSYFILEKQKRYFRLMNKFYYLSQD